MNNQRRKALRAAVARLPEIQAILKEVAEAIDAVKSDEEEAYGNLSEGQQSSETGDAMQEAISAMDEAVDAVRSVDVRAIEEAVGRAADEDNGLIAGPALDEAAIAERRQARLPSWARTEMERLRSAAATADARLAEQYGERDEDDRGQIAIDDYSSPVRHRILPFRQLSFPAYGIRVSADPHGRGVSIQATDFGNLSIMPQAANGVIARLTRD